MSVDTIQTDVSEQGEGRVLSPRELALNSIEAAYDERLVTIGQAERVVADEPVVIDDPEKYLIKVKLDGEEKLLTAAEIARGFQKDSVASERLRVASQRLKDVEAREAQLLSAADNGLSLDAQQQQLNSIFEDLVEEGNIDKAREKAAALLNSGRRQIDAPVREQAAAESEPEINPIFAQFLSQHPEFAPVDAGGEMVPTKERQMGDAIYVRDYAKQVADGKLGYLEALELTAGEVAKLVAVEKGAPLTRSEQVKERLAKVDNLPTASARAGAVSNDDDDDDSPSAVIANMRKLRGGI